MRKLLLIDCCIRKEQSQTKRLMEAFLHAAPADCAVERLVLKKISRRSRATSLPSGSGFWKAEIMRTRASGMPSSLRRRTLL